MQIEKCDATKWGIPAVCPVCGEPLEIIESKDGVKNLFCTNEKCPARSNEVVSAFLGRLGVMGVSNTTVANWGLNAITDVLSFKPKPSSKNEKKFVVELEKKLWNRSKKDILVALSALCYGVGRREMGKFIEKHGIDKICDPTTMFAPETVKEELIVDHIDDLRAACDAIFNDARYNEPEEVAEDEVEGAGAKGSICFTGALESMTRSEAQAKAKSLGFTIADGVSKNLGTLVVADAGLKGAPSSKLKKAMGMGIKIVSESEFNSWL